jgi:hypothetical protein
MTKYQDILKSYANGKDGLADYKPSESEVKTTRAVYQRYSDMKGFRQGAGNAPTNFESDWDDWEKMYMGRQPARKEGDWRSKIVVPIAFSLIESVMSDASEQYFGPRYKPVEEQDAAKADLSNHIVEYTMDKGNFKNEYMKAEKSACIFGTGIMQEYWRSDRRKLKDLIKFDPIKGIREYKEYDQTDFDDVYAENVNIRDFFIDEASDGFDGPKAARDCIRRYIISKNSFHRLYDTEFNNTNHVVCGGDTNRYEFYQAPQGIRDDEVEVLWYWNREEDKLIVVANDVLLKEGPIPYDHKELPFVRYPFVVRPNYFYGIGLPEIVESQQEELNTIRRMRLDNEHMSIHKMFLVGDNIDISEEDLVPRPHGMIRVGGDPAQFQPLEYSGTKRSAYEEEDRLKDDIVIATGIEPRMDLKSDVSATAEAIRKETLLKRVRKHFNLLKDESIKRLFELRISIIQQYYSQPQLNRISPDDLTDEYKQELRDENRFVTVDGEPYEQKYRSIRLDGKKLERKKENGTNRIAVQEVPGYSFFDIDPEILRAKLDVSVEIESMPISKAADQQRWDLLYDRATMNPTIDLVKITKKWLKHHEENPDDVMEGEADIADKIEEAREEFAQLMKGEKVPPNNQPTEEHIKEHDELLEGAVNYGELSEDSEEFANILNHVSDEIKILQGEQEKQMQEMQAAMAAQEGGQGQQGQPQGRQGGPINPNQAALTRQSPGNIPGTPAPEIAPPQE